METRHALLSSLRQRRTSALLIALVALASMSITPAAKAETALGPVLWQGEVRDVHRQSVPDAQVVAYVRPPGARLRAGDPLIPVAMGTTSPSGDFTLRTEFTEVLRRAQDGAGWISVMVAVLSEHGMALAIDSVAWAPATRVHTTGAPQRSDTLHGRWITSPTEREAEPGGTMHMTDTGVEKLLAHERPTVLVVAPGDPVSGMVLPTGKPGPVRGCSQAGVKELGAHPVPVGELHLNSHWAGFFEYTNTKSTSFQVGFSRDGKDWAVAGSVSMNDETQFTQEGALAPEAAGRMFTYDAEMVFKRFSWICGSEHQYYFAETIEPTQWTGSMQRRSGGGEPGCNSNYVAMVTPNTSAKRREGSGLTLHEAISVAGFKGSMTSTISKAVRHEYNNVLSHHRTLCGSTDFITNTTRVRSFG